MTTKTFICLALHFIFTGVYAQHHSGPAKVDQKQPLSFKGVVSQYLTDPALKGYKLESSVMTIEPGGRDTISHRHDCDLFGYVLEGSVEIGLEGQRATQFKTGDMFFEKRNILHTLTANSSPENSSRVLLIFIIKEGRKGYTAEYGSSVKNQQ
jgi:quercetin dioxygenase-like cupin family protein